MQASPSPTTAPAVVRLRRCLLSTALESLWTNHWHSGRLSPAWHALVWEEGSELRVSRVYCLHPNNQVSTTVESALGPSSLKPGADATMTSH